MTAPSPATASLLAVISDDLLQQLLSAHCTQNGILLLLAENPEAACHSLQALCPEVIVFDREFCRDAGDRLLELAEGREIPLIALCDSGDSSFPGNNAGAICCLEKPFSANALLAALQRAITPGEQRSGECLQCAGLKLNRNSRRVSFAGEEIPLHGREFDLLAYLMQSAERVFSRSQLLDALWGNERFIQERSVDVLVRRLRIALAAQGLSGYIETVRGAGYRFHLPTSAPFRASIGTASSLPVCSPALPEHEYSLLHHY